MINILSIILVLLFVGNSHICDILTSDINSWWKLRTGLYSIIIGLAFYISTMKHTIFSKVVISIGIGLTSSDIIDRVFFDINYFTWSDIIMIVISIAVPIFNNRIELINEIHKRTL